VPGLPELAQYSTTEIGQGQLWRLLTGHLTHWGHGHLFWDLSVFLVLGTLCEWRSHRAMLACVIGTAVATSLLMLFALPEIPTYRGLSGIDTGLFTMLGVGIYVDARNEGDRTLQSTIATMGAGLLTKLVYEIMTGSTIFVDHHAGAFIPIVGAHILGAVVGIVVGLYSAEP
jgi:rhomboid family GlyGly-CTERM serine protease